MPSSRQLHRTSKLCGLDEVGTKPVMLGEDGLRSLSTTGACTVIICAGACHLARQYWSGTSVNRRQEECALHTSKRRFVERMWSLVTQVRSCFRCLLAPVHRPFPSLRPTAAASYTGHRHRERSCQRFRNSGSSGSVHEHLGPGKPNHISTQSSIVRSARRI